MKKDPKGGGSNVDGSINLKYCSYCYVNGGFTQENITAHDMQIFVKDKLKGMGFPGFLAGFFTKAIPNLDRWEK